MFVFFATQCTEKTKKKSAMFIWARPGFRKFYSWSFLKKCLKNFSRLQFSPKLQKLIRCASSSSFTKTLLTLLSMKWLWSYVLWTRNSRDGTQKNKKNKKSDQLSACFEHEDQKWYSNVYGFCGKISNLQPCQEQGGYKRLKNKKKIIIDNTRKKEKHL